MLACHSSSKVPPLELPTHSHAEPERELTCAEALAALDEAVTARASTSELGAGALLAYKLPSPDTDGDGYLDDDDGCPELPEDFDAFEDDDGCPDCDDDGDGIPDAYTWSELEHHWINLDTDGEQDCRYEPEDFDGVEDDDGCPDLPPLRYPIFGETRCTDEAWRGREPDAWRSNEDRDDDGVYDDEDDCPDLPEDFDGFEDQDGCPDCDNDGDGVLDADVWLMLEGGPGWTNLDTNRGVDCRNEAEDFDGHRDEDGCPDK